MNIIFFTLIFSCLLFSQTSEINIQQFLNSYFSNYDSVQFEIIDRHELKNAVIDYSKSIIQKSDVLFLPVIYKNINKYKSSFIRLKVRLFKKVSVAMKDIQINSILNEEDFVYQLKDVTRLKHNIADKQNLKNKYKARFVIKKGDILFSDHLEEIPVLYSGDKLVLEINKGSVVITSECIARENGKIGETIDVLTFNNQIIKAKVINSKKVLVE